VSGGQRPPSGGNREIEGVYARIRESQRAPSVTVARSLSIRGFLSYYTKEMPGIARWAKTHGLIEMGFLRLRPRLRPEVMERLRALVTLCVIPAAPYAAKILEEGWKWHLLPMRDYNLVVSFVDFQRKIVALTQAGSYSRADFQKMADAFFRLVYNAGHTAALVSVLERLFGQNPGFPPQLTKSLACFFSPDCMRPSLRDIILAHAMVSYHRSLAWSDLLYPDLALAIPDRYYQCSLAVFEMMVMHLQGITRELAALRAERETIAWLQDRAEPLTGEIPRNLARFYSDLGRSWHADGGDVFLLLLSLVNGLVERLQIGRAHV
jgi:hypothetical protein